MPRIVLWDGIEASNENKDLVRHELKFSRANSVMVVQPKSQPKQKSSIAHSA